ncbi:MAG: cadmium-translocating P-type ATPase [Candidatus Doudnabacteria bacterium]|nr:cadmium-translocating P-type ATPase [Candidatus Doudnabacteria bacterium]
MDHNHHQGHTHDKHEGHSVQMFREKSWYSLLLTIPTLLYSEMVQNWLHFSPPAGGADFAKYIPLVFGTVLFFYSGIVFIRGAIAEIRSKLPGMMTLISLAIVTAFLYSLATTFFIQGTEFFWELSTLITIMIFGHWMEMKSVSSAQGALKELARLLPDTAELENGNKVNVSELKLGDLVLVRPGGKIPADGEVVEGNSSVNESMITGESELVKKSVGAQVIAGTVNSNGALKVKVTKVGENTALAGIMRLVAEAQASRSKAQVLADRAAFYLTMIAIVSGAITLIAWLLSGRGSSFALERTVTVLIIACPHALGLAVPLVTAISTSLAARNGLLVKNRLALESARNIDVVLFDKTGTLTLGNHGVAEILPKVGSKEDLMLIAAAVEANSEHPMARAIVARAREMGLLIPQVKDFKAIPGLGVEAEVHGKKYFVGRQENSSGIRVTENGSLIGEIILEDVIRPEARQTVESLKQMGIKVVMITGDSNDVAKKVAAKLGIEEFFAQVLPEHKVDKVRELQKDGSKVAMVGDGVNDAPALARADIGIAIGAGTDVAIESAGIILIKSDPRDIVKIIRLSRATYSKMVQNLIWATGYNIVAIPLAAGLFGIILPAAIGALLMSVSTIVVALNAQFLRKLKFD